MVHLDAANSTSYPGTGDTWFDLTTNGNNFSLGSLAGVDDADPLFINNAFVVDGNDFFTKIGSNGAFIDSIHQPGAQFTIEVWSLPASGGSYFIALGTTDNVGITGFRWFLEGALGGFNVNNAGTLGWNSPRSDLISAFNTWQMTAISVDATTGNGFTFLNGVPTPTGAASFTVDDTNTSTLPAPNLLRLGAQTNNGAALWPTGSQFAIYRIYDRALTETELVGNWCAQRWDFNL